jgi:hypothetical protein
LWGIVKVRFNLVRSFWCHFLHCRHLITRINLCIYCLTILKITIRMNILVFLCGCWQELWLVCTEKRISSLHLRNLIRLRKLLLLCSILRLWIWLLLLLLLLLLLN